MTDETFLTSLENLLGTGPRAAMHLVERIATLHLNVEETVSDLQELARG